MIEDHDRYYDESIAKIICNRLDNDINNNYDYHFDKSYILKTNLWGKILYRNIHSLQENNTKEINIVNIWKKLFNNNNIEPKIKFKIKYNYDDPDFLESTSVNFFQALNSNDEYYDNRFKKNIDFSDKEMAFLGQILVNENKALNLPIINNNTDTTTLVKFVSKYIDTLKPSIATELLINSHLINQLAISHFDDIKDLFSNINKKHFLKLFQIKDNIKNRYEFFNKIMSVFPPEDWLNIYVKDEILDIKEVFMKKLELVSSKNNKSINNEFIYYSKALNKYNIGEESIKLLYIITARHSITGDLLKNIYKTFGLPDNLNKKLEILIEGECLYEVTNPANEIESLPFKDIIHLAKNEMIYTSMENEILSKQKNSKIKI